MVLIWWLLRQTTKPLNLILWLIWNHIGLDREVAIELLKKSFLAGGVGPADASVHALYSLIVSVKYIIKNFRSIL